MVVERDEEGNIILLQRGNVLGTYVHGIFDNEDLAFLLVNNIANTKGCTLGADADFDYQAFKEGQYDKLAQVVRDNIDMAAVYRILNKED